MRRERRELLVRGRSAPLSITQGLQKPQVALDLGLRRAGAVRTKNELGRRVRRLRVPISLREVANSRVHATTGEIPLVGSSRSVIGSPSSANEGSARLVQQRARPHPQNRQLRDSLQHFPAPIHLECHSRFNPR